MQQNGINNANKTTWRVQTSEKTSKIQWDFPIQRYMSVNNFHEDLISFPEISVKLWKNATSRNVKESFKKFLDPDPNRVTSKIQRRSFCPK